MRQWPGYLDMHGYTQYSGVIHVTEAPVLAAVVEAQN